MINLPQRKKNRLQNYDYSQCGAYFVTICAKDRANLFGEIVGATVPGRPNTQYYPNTQYRPNTRYYPNTAQYCPYVHLNEIGEIINIAILHNNRNGIIIDKYVIMPNHIHMIVVIETQAGDRGRSPLQTIIRNMKAYVTKQIGFSPWQKSFHDHIIRNEKDYLRIAKYIENNPAKWEEDYFYS